MLIMHHVCMFLSCAVGQSVAGKCNFIFLKVGPCDISDILPKYLCASEHEMYHTQILVFHYFCLLFSSKSFK